ncbi:MAG TPA: glycosyltransferase family 4 protein [Terriglobales bacterium]|nr:glycosyltransferase family 4 protein [Terriglobales bacterium]
MNAVSQVGDQQSAGRVQIMASGRGQRTEDAGQTSSVSGLQSSVIGNAPLRVALLTGGGDKPYALGMGAALTSAGVTVDFIGSDDLNVPEVVNDPRVSFFNLRGSQNPEASRLTKVTRVLKYYLRLIGYATKAKPKLFHLLWNNKLELFDRTLLMLYYKLLGKQVLFTAHNVNAGKRDSNDSWLNQVSLRIQYSLLDHIFVHTNEMKRELISEFPIPAAKVSVIPFGINNTVPKTNLSSADAKRQLGIGPNDKTLLFFGNIAPYKGLEYLIAAFEQLLAKDGSYRLLIVGSPKGPRTYWNNIARLLEADGIKERTIQKIEYVPDEATELYFKAADILVLPYVHVFQSGVLFLSYSFGVPAIAADVGSLREEIVEGETGFVFKARDSADLASKIETYFDSDLFCSLETRRRDIKAYANDRYSWDKVAAVTTAVYVGLLRGAEVRNQRSEVTSDSAS